MEAPLCGNKKDGWKVFAYVGIASLIFGAAVGLSSGQPASSVWVATTKNVASARTTTLPLNIQSQLNQAVLSEMLVNDVVDANDDEIVEIHPAASSTPSVTSIVGFGAIVAAGILALRSAVGSSKPKHRQDVNLENIWSMASSTGQNLGAGKTIRIATRKSPLAMWQAEFIQSELERLWPGITIELQPMSTKGDKILDSPLAKVGGKGLFVKELETALLEGRSDIAVHSTKDVPMELPEGLVLGIICKRHDPCDAIVFPKGSTLKSLDDLPKGARVGTSSLRRQCQLLLKRPDLKFLELRGNVNTRLAKLDSGDYDAIILAAAGLKRLGFSDRVLPGETNIIDPDAMLPAAGQGALSIELRVADKDVAALLEPLHHVPDAVTVCCERAMNRRLSGGCQVPISGFAQLKDGNLRMEARVGSVTGSGPLIIKHKTIPFTLDKPWPELQKQSEALGVDVAELLLAAGAQAYLDEAYTREDVGVGLAASQK